MRLEQWQAAAVALLFWVLIMGPPMLVWWAAVR